MIETLADTRRADVARILTVVPASPARRRHPALAVLVGLPASGKSSIARGLSARTGAVVIESDAVRRLLFSRPSYSGTESRRLFRAIHAAIEQLLADGRSAILDATNVAEDEREPLYSIAERTTARFVLVQVTAPPRVLRARLIERETSAMSNSEADLGVYERMRARVDTIQRPHHVVDTSGEIDATLAAIAKEMSWE
jgi:predicted kinase